MAAANRNATGAVADGNETAGATAQITQLGCAAGVVPGACASSLPAA